MSSFAEKLLRSSATLSILDTLDGKYLWKNVRSDKAVHKNSETFWLQNKSNIQYIYESPG